MNTPTQGHWSGGDLHTNGFTDVVTVAVVLLSLFLLLLWWWWGDGGVVMVG